MEPVTHLLTGACLSRTGFNRKTALATLTMTLAAEASDLDVFAYFGGSSFGFAHHRGFTHTVWGIPIVAAATLAFVYGLNWVWRKWRDPRRPASAPPVVAPRWKLLYLFACIAGFSHLLLDFTNQYGVRLFWPFINHWYSWDIVFIVEPIILVMLIAALIFPALFGLVSSEVGARQKGPRGRGWAIAALMGMVLLWGVRDYQHRRAIAALNSLDYQGAQAIRVAATPYHTNPFIWNGLVETEGFYETVRVNSLTPEVDPNGHALTYYKTEQTDAMRKAQASYTGRVYMDWSQWPVLEAQRQDLDDRGTRVVFRDLRFMYPERNGSGLSAFVRLDDKLKVVDEGFLAGRRERAGD
jgi:inner membrane protein